MPSPNESQRVAFGPLSRPAKPKTKTMKMKSTTRRRQDEENSNGGRTLRPSSGWTGAAKSTLSVSTIAPPASAKPPPWSTPPKPSRNGRPRWQSASPKARSPSAWSKPKAPSSPRSWLIPSSCFTRSTRPPPPVTARPLRPAGPRAIPPMRRSASSCSSTTATNSLPGGPRIPRPRRSPGSWNNAAARSICAPSSPTCCAMPSRATIPRP